METQSRVWCWDCSINTKLSRLGIFHFPFSAVSPDFIFGSAGMPWATPYPLALFWFITPTHTHTHTLCKAAFIRVVMPVKSKTDNWRVPGVYKNNKHKHEVCNNIRWHASIVFWCGFAGKLGCSRTQGSKGSKIKTILPCFVHPGREDVWGGLLSTDTWSTFPHSAISASKQWNAVYSCVFSVYSRCLCLQQMSNLENPRFMGKDIQKIGKAPSLTRRLYNNDIYGKPGGYRLQETATFL
jgi:hypothetical protein